MGEARTEVLLGLLVIVDSVTRLDSDRHKMGRIHSWRTRVEEVGKEEKTRVKCKPML
jgi:hypothetical protein